MRRMRAVAVVAAVMLGHAIVITSLGPAREPSGRGHANVAQALTVRSIAWAAPARAGAPDVVTVGGDAWLSSGGADARAAPEARVDSGRDRAGAVTGASLPAPKTTSPMVRAVAPPRPPKVRSTAPAPAPADRAPSRVASVGAALATSGVPRAVAATVVRASTAQPAGPVPEDARGSSPGGAAQAGRETDPSPAAVTPPADTFAAADDEPAPGAADALAMQEALRSLPSYRVRLPPSQRLRFRVTHGEASGDGVLEWTHDEGSYRAALRVQGVGLPGLYWTSEGGAAGEQGVLPRRMVAHRKGRPFATARFEAEARKVSFSGVRIERPFVPGGQDRLSWMVQLAGVLEAREQPLRAGENIVLYVVGPRGAAELWQLRVAGHETLTDEHGDTPTIKLVRDAQRLYDTEIELWLDPARLWGTKDIIPLAC